MTAMKKTEIAPRAGTGLVRTRRTRIARIIPSPPVAHPTRTWLRELLSPPPPHSYLAAGEQCLITTRLHWIVPLRTMVRAAGAMSLAGLGLMVLSFLTPGVFLLQAVLFLLTLAHTTYLFYSVLAWRADHIMVTDSRIIRVSGLITHTVDAMRLSKITDTTLTRPFLGRILDYGTIRIESSGQRQSLERIDYVPSPGEIYRATLAHLSAP